MGVCASVVVEIAQLSVCAIAGGSSERERTVAPAKTTPNMTFMPSGTGARLRYHPRMDEGGGRRSRFWLAPLVAGSIALSASCGQDHPGSFVAESTHFRLFVADDYDVARWGA